MTRCIGQVTAAGETIRAALGLLEQGEGRQVAPATYAVMMDDPQVTGLDPHLRTNRGSILVDQLHKAPTGIQGLDELTRGGLPAGRPTLVCGGPGCGKTLLATTFLVHGAVDHAEPGLLVSFDERIEDLAVNVASLGFDLPDLQRRRLLATDYVRIDRQEMHETGEYDLEALFIRLGYAVQSVGARRVVIDTIDTLFAGIPNEAIVRSELRRLFDWLKDRQLSTVITAERGERGLTRHGIEEYVSDCVILLDHRIVDDLSTRRLRVVKYRGTSHGTNEYPFLIDDQGITVVPITSIQLSHLATDETVSSGVPELDSMLGAKGYFRGSSTLLSGGPGTGKTTIGAHFADRTCSLGERCMYFSFEESPSQILRNMRSAGINLQPWIDQGLLRVQSSRPSLGGLEMHLALMLKALRDFSPSAVVIDPLSALVASGMHYQTASMAVRLADYLKSKTITALYLSLQDQEGPSGLDISSIMDTWIVIRNERSDSEFTRRLHIVKARGMEHSSAVRRMLITGSGVRLTDFAAGAAQAERSGQ
jgi:circadian clock protein KaiC